MPFPLVLPFVSDIGLFGSFADGVGTASHTATLSSVVWMAAGRPRWKRNSRTSSMRKCGPVSVPLTPRRSVAQGQTLSSRQRGRQGIHMVV